ncbi:MAG: hypothetical protein CVV64_19725 [Candidatus Wallbacteria bacterium HGW-Wallbacteria-1]|uniref:Uncharacterized protein n=1 Tax=Candidatus Wallbacteria bacterium HGW-Wallbacteria-1 TaxID=2013854 RepID=A0A2N1PIT0_9BACT|nr:MAG: hypothetical protein CVV64_19725 [Candidatus Wallbacteria bacterium HGW-Wallbacteria-1]
MKVKLTNLELIRQSFYRGEFDKSKTFALEYLETAANRASALMNMYFIYIALSDRQKAKEAFNEAIRIDPEAYYAAYDDSILKFSAEQTGLTHDEIDLLTKALK